MKKRQTVAQCFHPTMAQFFRQQIVMKLGSASPCLASLIHTPLGLHAFCRGWSPRRCDKGGMAEQEGGTMGSASPRPYPPPEPPCNPPFVGSTDSSIRNIGAYERAFLLVAHFVSRDASVVLPFPTNNTKIINLYKLENTPK